MNFAALALSTWLAQPTYSGQTAAILNEHCVRCHRPGESAPFPLDSFDEARKHAAQIAAVTATGRMPPWPPEPGYGDFEGGRRLSTTEIAALAAWAKAGAPSGDLSKAPPAPRFTAGWQLGEPDLILRMDQPFEVPAAGRDVFRNFILRNPLESGGTRWIRAIELRPGNKRLVHHANIVVDRTRSMRARDGRDGQPGFSGMDIETEGGDEFDPDSHFLFWKPGGGSTTEPDGMPWKLDSGTDLVVNLHLRPTGKPERVQATLGLYFAKSPPTKHPILIQLEHDGAIDIPPSARDFTIADHVKLPLAVDLLAVYPHAHYLGKRIEAWAELPGGRRVELLRINNWDINWQAAYRYRKPVALPAGTVLAMRIRYDNPTTQRVRAGDRSEDEMGHVWFQVLPAKADDRQVLAEAAMRRRLEKYPADFLAHFNLAAVTRAPGEAVTLLERAVQIRPTNATARNSLGAALLEAGRVDDAITAFRAVLAADPGYANARYNLGQALAARGDIDAGVTELKAYVATRPDDGRAHYTLGGVLASAGRVRDALPYLRRAAELLASDAEVQANLGTALAMTGDPQGAVAAYERSLLLDPANAAVRANLQKAKGAARVR